MTKMEILKYRVLPIMLIVGLGVVFFLPKAWTNRHALKAFQQEPVKRSYTTRIDANGNVVFVPILDPAKDKELEELWNKVAR